MDGGTARYNIMSTIDDVEDTDDENDDDFVPGMCDQLFMTDRRLGAQYRCYV